MSSGKTIVDPEMTKWVNDIDREGSANKFLFLGDRNGGFSVVVSNWSWWDRNKEPVLDYCSKHDITVNGMLLKFPSDKIMTLFMLRWGN